MNAFTPDQQVEWTTDDGATSYGVVLPVDDDRIIGANRPAIRAGEAFAVLTPIGSIWIIEAEDLRPRGTGVLQVEVDTAVSRDGITYRIRQVKAENELWPTLAEFRLNPQQAFRAQLGTAMVVRATAVVDTGAKALNRIVALLDRLTSDDGESQTERSVEQIAQAMLRGRKVNPEHYIELIDELSGEGKR